MRMKLRANVRDDNATVTRHLTGNGNGGKLTSGRATVAMATATIPAIRPEVPTAQDALTLARDKLSRS